MRIFLVCMKNSYNRIVKPKEVKMCEGIFYIATLVHESTSVCGYFLHSHTEPILLVGHELFDALPIHQFQYTERGWREKLVDIDDTPDGEHHFRYLCPLLHAQR